MNEHSGKTVVKAVIFALVYPGDTECTNDILFYFLWPAEGKTMISWNDTFWIIDNIQVTAYWKFSEKQTFLFRIQMRI